MYILDERNFLAKELETKGFQVFDFYENAKLLKFSEFLKLPLGRRADVLLVDTQSVLSHPEKLGEFQSILNTFLGVIFFHENGNQKAHEWVLNQAAFMTKIVGTYSLPMPELEWTMLSNQLQFFWNLLQEQKNLQRHITQFSQELDQVLQTAEWEMSKAKKIHEILIPRRSDEIKGIKFQNKYAAGEGGSGEFYDLHQSGNNVYQIFVASQSYLISSSLMGVLNNHKQKEFSTTAFLQDCINEIRTINGAKKKKSEVDVMILEINTNNLHFRAHGWGRAEVYGHDGAIPLGIGPVVGEQMQGTEHQLQRGDKLVVCSAGFLSNWKDHGPKQSILPFLQGYQQLSQSELLMELFFHIKKDNESDFLSKDATVVMIEVNRHGIHQI